MNVRTPCQTLMWSILIVLLELDGHGLSALDLAFSFVNMYSMQCMVENTGDKKLNNNEDDDDHIVFSERISSFERV